MKIKFTSKLLPLIVLLALALGCKKENPSSANGALTGSWTETPLEAQFNRTLYFGADGSFTLHAGTVGSSLYGSTLNGTYVVNGNELHIDITEEISTQQIAAPTITKVNYPLLDKATFSVVGNKLTVKYVSYPADGPVATVMRLVKN